LSAFQAYSGAYADQRQSYRWSCYATCRIYEVRSFDDALPEAPKDRKWVWKPQHASGGPHLAMLVDRWTSEFSQMLAQITPRQVEVEV